MLRNITIIFSVILLFSFSLSYCQSTSNADNFMPDAYKGADEFLDQNNLFYQLLEDEQNYHIGNFYYKRRDAYLRRGLTDLRSIKRAANPFDYNYTGGVQFFGAIGGFGINVLSSKRINKDLRINFHLGFLSMSNRYYYNRFNPYLTELNSSVLIIPSYIGVQRFISSSHLPKRVKVYVEAGAGPIIGMNTPNRYGFFESFRMSQYRVTPGGFAGGGVTVRLMNGYFIFADLKYHVMVFNGELGYRNNYSTPTVYFGINRGFSLFN
ncbi:hypothetical protein ACFL40_04805 [candidate division KSB1 bacterium]